MIETSSEQFITRNLDKLLVPNTSIRHKRDNISNHYMHGQNLNGDHGTKPSGMAGRVRQHSMMQLTTDYWQT